jgi:ABC-2 type transport system permease protein
MNSTAQTIPDSLTMLRRVLVHMSRNPVATLMSSLGTPMVLLVLMYNLFSEVVQKTGAMGAGIRYIDYLTPGLIMITAIYGMATTTIRVNSDMTQGIIARFRTMSIARIAVLNGHVIGSALGTLVGLAVIIALAYLTGFRPVNDPLAWLAAFGLITLLVVSVTWLSVVIDVSSKSPESASSLLLLFYILPFLSSAFVPTSSMTPVLAWIAENQPFSPIIDTMRALLIGGEVGTRGLVAVAWCVALTLVGYIWARTAYNRTTSG